MSEEQRLQRRIEHLERLLRSVCDEVETNLYASASSSKLTTLPPDVAQWYYGQVVK